MERCDWCKDNGIMQEYHDTECGIPIHDDRKQFEYLMMEVMQCGLNWRMMLKKREIFRRCFDNFDYEKIAEYNDDDVMRIMNTEGMIRSKRKIRAVINNAKQFIKLRKEKGSFDEYLWKYSKHMVIVYDGHPDGHIPAKNELSDIISRDLKKRGFQYLGSITVYSHIQACGLVNDHHRKCDCYKRIVKNNKILQMACAGEE